MDTSDCRDLCIEFRHGFALSAAGGRNLRERTGRSVFEDENAIREHRFKHFFRGRPDDIATSACDDELNAVENLSHRYGGDVQVFSSVAAKPLQNMWLRRRAHQFRHNIGIENDHRLMVLLLPLHEPLWIADGLAGKTFQFYPSEWAEDLADTLS